MQTRAKISLWEERISSDIYESSPISWCWLLERGDFMTHGPFSRLYWVSNWDQFSQDLVWIHFTNICLVMNLTFITMGYWHQLLVFSFERVFEEKKRIESLHFEDELPIMSNCPSTAICPCPCPSAVSPTCLVLVLVQFKKNSHFHKSYVMIYLISDHLRELIFVDSFIFESG